MTSGTIIYEDNRYILADFSDNFGINYQLMIKGGSEIIPVPKTTVTIYSYASDEGYVIAVKLTEMLEERIHVKITVGLRKYLKLKDRLSMVREPKEFIMLFLELASPSLAKLCKEVLA